MLRGIRQRRFARIHRSPERSHRHTQPGGLPRCRLRQLRAALGDDLVARQYRRQPDGESADGRCAFRNGQRHYRFQFPDPARPARPAGRHQNGRHQGQCIECRCAGLTPERGASCCGNPRQRNRPGLAVCRRHAAGQPRSV